MVERRMGKYRFIFFSPLPWERGWGEGKTKNASKISGRRIRTQLSLKRLIKIPKTKCVSGTVKSDSRRAYLLLLSRLLLSAPELHRVLLWSQEACFRYLQEQALALHMLAGCTADRELHPAPKVEYLVAWIITCVACHCEGWQLSSGAWLFVANRNPAIAMTVCLLQLRFQFLGSVFICSQFITFLLNNGGRRFVGKVAA